MLNQQPKASDMRIFAIGRNYAEHIKELNNERPDEPVIFTKPDTAVLRQTRIASFNRISELRAQTKLYFARVARAGHIERW